MEIKTNNMKKLIKDIIINNRIRKDPGDLTDLKESIKKYGLINPITVDPFNNLIAGERRLEAMKQLGHCEIDFNLMPQDIGNNKQIDENVVRSNFTPEEIYDYWQTLENHQFDKSCCTESVQQRQTHILQIKEKFYLSHNKLNPT